MCSAIPSGPVDGGFRVIGPVYGGFRVMGYWASIWWVGLDKICLAKIEQNGQPKERSNSASKMGCQFCQKSKMGKE